MVLEPNIFFHLDGPFQAVFDAKRLFSPIAVLTRMCAEWFEWINILIYFYKIDVLNRKFKTKNKGCQQDELLLIIVVSKLLNNQITLHR